LRAGSGGARTRDPMRGAGRRDTDRREKFCVWGDSLKRIDL